MACCELQLSEKEAGVWVHKGLWSCMSRVETALGYASQCGRLAKVLPRPSLRAPNQLWWRFVLEINVQIASESLVLAGTTCMTGYTMAVVRLPLPTLLF